jgi:hypothetical protein
MFLSIPLPKKQLNNTVPSQNEDENIYDLNGDGKVNLQDLEELMTHFGATENDGKWDSRCDFNGDGVINMLDATILSSNFTE